MTGNDIALQNHPSHQEEHAADRAKSGWLRRIGVALVGVSVILVGIPLIPLLGPGWLIVFAGLAILAKEFEWASRLHSRVHTKMRGLLGNRNAEEDD